MKFNIQNKKYWNKTKKTHCINQENGWKYCNKNTNYDDFKNDEASLLFALFLMEDENVEKVKTTELALIDVEF